MTEDTPISSDGAELKLSDLLKEAGVRDEQFEEAYQVNKFQIFELLHFMLVTRLSIRENAIRISELSSKTLGDPDLPTMEASIKKIDEAYQDLLKAFSGKVGGHE